MVIATKFGHQDGDMGYGPAAGAKGGRAYLRRAVEHSLRRLRTEGVSVTAPPVAAWPAGTARKLAMVPRNPGA